MSNTVLFAVWNRPEMLKIVMENFLEAYEYHPLEDIKILFAIEGGAPDKVLELVNEFPMEKKIIIRPDWFGRVFDYKWFFFASSASSFGIPCAVYLAVHLRVIPRFP